MKAKSRRRLLISSIAMLLVAMLALGTATFAWFTQNTRATADGIYAKTTKASTLLISKANHSWNTAVTYSQGSSSSAQVMFPASSGDGTSWFEATSDNKTTGALKAGTVKAVTPADTNAKFVYKEELNVKNGGETGAPAINNIKIEWNWPTDTADYARIALVECSETGDVTGTFTSSVYAQNNRAYQGLTATDGTGANITPNTATSINVGTLTAGAAKYYKLFVWFEGQDTACIDTNASQTLNDLKFTVTGEPAAN